MNLLLSEIIAVASNNRSCPGPTPGDNYTIQNQLFRVISFDSHCGCCNLHGLRAEPNIQKGKNPLAQLPPRSMLLKDMKSSSEQFEAKSLALLAYGVTVAGSSDLLFFREQ
ncbi:hypothetical protein AXFE_06760 [Acidithrix ferrooxidans]|uniref:Uncharacterized protein n=1 Tax=Acidithrix ferrooxidans TaxID=1280514 RepID=A0A0D8HKK4_9ACTN|nr:hypothetical protein AXFE_06760 [Acidithrix ferrooxidans]